MVLAEFFFSSMKRQLDRIEINTRRIMATYAEVKQAWVDYTTDLKSQRDAAVAALNDAQTAAQDAADALAAFQVDDSATDAQQLADQAQSFADDLNTTLESIKNPPVEPEPLPEEPPVEEPPVEG